MISKKFASFLPLYMLTCSFLFFSHSKDVQFLMNTRTDKYGNLETIAGLNSEGEKFISFYSKPIKSLNGDYYVDILEAKDINFDGIFQPDECVLFRFRTPYHKLNSNIVFIPEYQASIKLLADPILLNEIYKAVAPNDLAFTPYSKD